MGLTYATLKLTNQYDEYKFGEGLIPQDQIRELTVDMMVDTGSIRLAINEEIRTKLGLKIGIPMQVSLADGTISTKELVGGIKVSFGNRSCYTDAFVLPGNTEPLLGAIPIEGMDLAVVPAENTLIYNPKHPDGALFSLK